MNQIELISPHEKLSNELTDSDIFLLRGHLEHLLLALRRVVESYGPTPEYQLWTRTTQKPKNLSDQLVLSSVDCYASRARTSTPSLAARAVIFLIPVRREYCGKL